MIGRGVSLLLLVLGAAVAASGQSLQPAGTTIAPPEPVQFTRISPDGRRIAAACRDKRLRVFSLPDGKLEQTLELGDTTITVLAYSRDGQRLAAGGRNGTVRVFEAATGAVVHESMAGPLGIKSLALSPDGKRLAVGSLDLPVQVWDVAQHTQTAELKAWFAGSTALAFSPDGKLLATTNGDTTVQVFDAAAGRLRWSFEELDLESFDLDFSPDSRTLVVGGADRVLVALDSETGKVRQRSPRQPDPIGALAVLADGRTVVASSFNADDMAKPGALVSWSLADGGLQKLAAGITFNGGGGSAPLLLTSIENGALKLWAIR